MITLKTKKDKQSFKLKSFIVAAVRKRTAAFFYSTKSPSYQKERTKIEIINTINAAEIQRLRLFIVAKDHYMTFYRSRAPPLQI